METSSQKDLQQVQKENLLDSPDLQQQDSTNLLGDTSSIYQMNNIETTSAIGDENYLCPLHSKPYETFCTQDQQLMCIECAKTEHRLHEKIHVTDLIFKLNERLNGQVS